MPARNAGTLRPALALVLLVPAPGLGVLAAMFLWPGTRTGAALFVLSKVWFFALPAVWLRLVDREPFGLSPARAGGYGTGLVTGLGLSAAVLLAYALFGGRLVDPAALRDRLVRIGLGTPGLYLAGAVYWILVNSVLEEYAWRWFCLEKCRALFPGPAAVGLSALFFTLHHSLALLALTSTAAAVLCSAGVFTGALVWSSMCARYRSIWPGYLSHALVDACIFGIGGFVAFGGP